MGFFDKIFGSKAAATKFSGQKMTVLAPIDSTVIPLEQLPDETFATAILGPGCGLEPTGDTQSSYLTHNRHPRPSQETLSQDPFLSLHSEYADSQSFPRHASD